MDGMNRSAETVYKLIQGEVRAGIPTDRILIGGFSQGNPIEFHKGHEQRGELVFDVVAGITVDRLLWKKKSQNQKQASSLALYPWVLYYGFMDSYFLMTPYK